MKSSIYAPTVTSRLSLCPCSCQRTAQVIRCRTFESRHASRGRKWGQTKADCSTQPGVMVLGKVTCCIQCHDWWFSVVYSILWCITSSPWLMINDI